MKSVEYFFCPLAVAIRRQLEYSAAAYVAEALLGSAAVLGRAKEVPSFIQNQAGPWLPAILAVVGEVV